MSHDAAALAATADVAPRSRAGLVTLIGVALFLAVLLGVATIGYPFVIVLALSGTAFMLAAIVIVTAGM